MANNKKEATTKQQKKDYQKSTEERLDDEIELALKSVTVTKFRTEQLHQNWRDHLFRLSCGVVLLTMHQYSQPIGECIADLKSVQPEIQVAPLTAIKVLFSDGLVELCNVIIAFLLFRFTGRKQPGNFSTPAFVTAAAMIPFVLGLYFNSERVGCIVDSDGGIVVDADGHAHGHGHGHAQSGKTERQFPVAVLYHLIVTGCVWFMNYFMDQTDKNLASVTKLHKELSSKNSRKNK